jgi:hypothetical protein
LFSPSYSSALFSPSCCSSVIAFSHSTAGEVVMPSLVIELIHKTIIFLEHVYKNLDVVRLLSFLNRICAVFEYVCTFISDFTLKEPPSKGERGGWASIFETSLGEVDDNKRSFYSLQPLPSFLAASLFSVPSFPPDFVLKYLKACAAMEFTLPNSIFLPTIITSSSASAPVDFSQSFPLVSLLSRFRLSVVSRSSPSPHLIMFHIFRSILCIFNKIDCGLFSFDILYHPSVIRLTMGLFLYSVNVMKELMSWIVGYVDSRHGSCRNAEFYFYGLDSLINELKQEAEFQNVLDTFYLVEAVMSRCLLYIEKYYRQEQLRIDKFVGGDFFFDYFCYFCS